ncbi:MULTISPECIES: hypothetical protein [Planktothrix]|uniref:SAM-dependent methyltransferase n=1 Tax=Planktothrix rubescens CCAP 1459/22 TaxID=329571 RepID=A0A6J7ZRQ9_PLARU|nr:MULTISPECIES: hypothetical protein [Planktothrix]CAC5344706.1 putative sAM-dependent methyltransferase [Planktothrix rubescens NIVA-CYA 18]CAD5921331.1 putative protein MJ0045 [Planktothrix rubescens NIVA-CYA 18]
MGLQLNNVIPWGRSLSEYIRMFDLTPDDLQQSILDCAGGPASFNIEMIQRGYQIISCDPIYQFSADDIYQRIQNTYTTVIDGVKASSQDYVWDSITSPETLGEMRMAAMEQFLADFTIGKQQGRYLTAELPQLPFKSSQFNLALCSHFLFTYSDHFSEEFHLEAILDLYRIAQQVRIFPLLKVSGETSPFLQPIIQELETRGYMTMIKTVNYEFQKNGNQMLQIQK